MKRPSSPSTAQMQRPAAQPRFAQERSRPFRRKRRFQVSHYRLVGKQKAQRWFVGFGKGTDGQARGFVHAFLLTARQNGRFCTARCAAPYGKGRAARPSRGRRIRAGPSYDGRGYSRPRGACRRTGGRRRAPARRGRTPRSARRSSHARSAARSTATGPSMRHIPAVHPVAGRTTRSRACPRCARSSGARNTGRARAVRFLIARAFCNTPIREKYTTSRCGVRSRMFG